MGVKFHTICVKFHDSWIKFHIGVKRHNISKFQNFQGPSNNIQGQPGHGRNMGRHAMQGGQMPRPRQTNPQHQNQQFVQQQKRY